MMPQQVVMMAHVNLIHVQAVPTQQRVTTMQPQQSKMVHV